MDDCCSVDKKEACGSGCACEKEVDIEKLGHEAKELAHLFNKVSENLTSALKLRKEILALINENSKDPEMKEKIDLVLGTRHPVLIQFVLGDQE